MKKLSAKYKIIIVLAGFLLFAVGMFTFGYGILDKRNEALANTASQLKVEYDILQREQKSFQQGKKDVETLASKEFPPGELFSRDTKVVKEIQLLEQTAARYGVEMKLAISGTVKSAVKVPGTSSELLAIPYNMTLDGSFEDILKFIETSERLSFVTSANVVNITAIKQGQVRATISSEFYIKK